MSPKSLTLMVALALPLPALPQEAIAAGLVGKVHSVLTEDIDYQDNPSGVSRGSVFELYDPKGYQLELYRYKPDGSLWAHTVFIRDGWKIFELQATGTAPFESITTRNFFDAEGHIVETDTYNENGVLINQSKNEFLLNQSDKTLVRSRETGANGEEHTRDIEEKTDPKMGITRQVVMMNGQPETDWTIQRNESGEALKDKIVYADGSYNERERMPDGTTAEDRYSAVRKGHTYQKSDSASHLIEVIQDSESSYVRWTYSFDKAGRPTGQINYDRAGLILDRSRTEYVDDANGNWIEKKEMVWDTKSDPATQRVVLVSLRTVVYD